MAVLSYNWNSPADDALLTIAQVITKYLRFFDPAVIKALALDNRKHTRRWSAALEAKGIDPRLYLWEGSACCFPGVRRYHGAAEKACCSGKQDKPDQNFPDALVLDFDTYPKELCTYLLGDRVIRNYSLMHILNPSEINEQLWVEDTANYIQKKAVYGLFTNPGNTVYVPNGMVAFFSTNKKLRCLLIERQLRLYYVCNMVPPGVRIRPKRQDRGADWHIDRFEWAPCFGGEASLKEFLAYRKGLVENLL